MKGFSADAPSGSAVRRAVAETLRALRVSKGIAQEALALTAGIDRAYMGKLERGTNSPSTETIWKVLAALDVSYVQFARELDRRYKRIAGGA